MHLLLFHYYFSLFTYYVFNPFLSRLSSAHSIILLRTSKVLPHTSLLLFDNGLSLILLKRDSLPGWFPCSLTFLLVEREVKGIVFSCQDALFSYLSISYDFLIYSIFALFLGKLLVAGSFDNLKAITLLLCYCLIMVYL